MSKQSDKDISAVSPVEGGRRLTGTGETKAAPKRFWAQHKTEAVLRLLRGEDIETLSRELGVTAQDGIDMNTPLLSVCFLQLGMPLTPVRLHRAILSHKFNEIKIKTDADYYVVDIPDHVIDLVSK